MLKQLWTEEAGSVNSAELVLIITLLTIGILVGMKSLRDSVVTEFADFGQALAELDQSYSYSGFTTTTSDGVKITTASSSFDDEPDFCDTQSETHPSDPSKCVTVCETPSGEG